MTITGALEQTLWKAFAFQRLRARTQNVILLKRDRVCRRRHAKTKETRRYGADENRSVLEKNRTEPVKNRGAEKKYLCFSRDFIRVVFICLLTEVVYTCWRWWNGERDVAGSESAKRLGRFFPGRGPLYTREESSRTGGKEVKKVPEISILDQDAEERRDCVRRKPGCCVRFPGGRGVREK
jgi:hypothetical protein